MMIASSSNGRTADSDSVNLGSSPGEAAIKKTPRQRGFFGVVSPDENQDLVRNRKLASAREQKREAYEDERGPRKVRGNLQSRRSSHKKPPRQRGFFILAGLFKVSFEGHGGKA